MGNLLFILGAVVGAPLGFYGVRWILWAAARRAADLSDR